MDFAIRRRRVRLAQLPPERFKQIHRDTVVNLDEVAAALHDDAGRISLTLRHRKRTLAVSRVFAGLFRQMQADDRGHVERVMQPERTEGIAELTDSATDFTRSWSARRTTNHTQLTGSPACPAYPARLGWACIRLSRRHHEQEHYDRTGEARAVLYRARGGARRTRAERPFRVNNDTAIGRYTAPATHLQITIPNNHG